MKMEIEMEINMEMTEGDGMVCVTGLRTVTQAGWRARREETVGVGEQCISPFGEPCSIHSNCDSCFLVTKDFNEPAS